MPNAKTAARVQFCVRFSNAASQASSASVIRHHRCHVYRIPPGSHVKAAAAPQLSGLRCACGEESQPAPKAYYPGQFAATQGPTVPRQCEGRVGRTSSLCASCQHEASLLPQTSPCKSAQNGVRSRPDVLGSPNKKGGPHFFRVLHAPRPFRCRTQPNRHSQSDRASLAQSRATSKGDLTSKSQGTNTSCPHFDSRVPRVCPFFPSFFSS